MPGSDTRTSYPLSGCMPARRYLQSTGWVHQMGGRGGRERRQAAEQAAAAAPSSPGGRPADPDRVASPGSARWQQAGGALGAQGPAAAARKQQQRREQELCVINDRRHQRQRTCLARRVIVLGFDIGLLP